MKYFIKTILLLCLCSYSVISFGQGNIQNFKEFHFFDQNKRLRMIKVFCSNYYDHNVFTCPSDLFVMINQMKDYSDYGHGDTEVPVVYVSLMSRKPPYRHKDDPELLRGYSLYDKLYKCDGYLAPLDKDYVIVTRIDFDDTREDIPLKMSACVHQRGQ